MNSKGDFRGWRDWLAVIAAALLVLLGLASIFGWAVPQVVIIAGILFAVGGFAGLSDAFSVFGAMWKFLYVILFLIVLLMGVMVFFPIPGLGFIISVVPATVTHYIVNFVVAAALVVVAFHSN